jgi:hypothetical protein
MPTGPLLAVAVLVIAVTTGVANATTKVNVDAGWQSFITGGGLDGASTAGPWVFSNTTVTKVTATDAFCRGDEFRVYDKDALIGQTSEVESDIAGASALARPGAIVTRPHLGVLCLPIPWSANRGDRSQPSTVEAGHEDGLLAPYRCWRRFSTLSGQGA